MNMVNQQNYLTVSSGLGTGMKCEVINIPAPHVAPKLCC